MAGRPKVAKKPACHQDWNPDCKLWVGNLGEEGNRLELEEAFSQIGPIANIWVARNPPSFAYVEMEDPRDAEDAMKALDGTELCGRRARVEMAKSREEKRRDNDTRNRPAFVDRRGVAYGNITREEKERFAAGGGGGVGGAGGMGRRDDRRDRDRNDDRRRRDRSRDRSRSREDRRDRRRSRERRDSDRDRDFRRDDRDYDDRGGRGSSARDRDDRDDRRGGDRDDRRGGDRDDRDRDYRRGGDDRDDRRGSDRDDRRGDDRRRAPEDDQRWSTW